VLAEGWFALANGTRIRILEERPWGEFFGVDQRTIEEVLDTFDGFFVAASWCAQ
jgi:hypothetical protein